MKAAEIQVLPEKNLPASSTAKTNKRSQYLRCCVNRHKKSPPMNKGSSLPKEMENLDKSLLSNNPVDYGYIKHIQTYKKLCNSTDKSLKKKVR